MLLQTWNKSFYRFRAFDNQHFSEIENAIDKNYAILLKIRGRNILSFCSADEKIIESVFNDFEKVLGPVGTAKCLHLLAPRFFPLWDRAIANAYRLALKTKGANASRYCRFMKITQDQCQQLGREMKTGRNLLKAIDEYNYCKHTKNWI